MYYAFGRWFRKYWGFSIFSLLSVLGFMRLLRQDVPGHYRIFVGAARALWTGVNPHGTDFGTGVGFWFYSPSCAMFLFGPFTLIPETLGLAIYMTLSWFVFVLGAQQFHRAATVSIQMPAEQSNQIHNFFWLVTAPQMMTAILTSKLEVLMTGMLLLAASYLIKNRSRFLCGFAMATILNWKFQPLPTLGLISMAAVILGVNWQFLMAIVLGSVFWIAVPHVFLSAHFLSEVYQRWKETLSPFVETSFMNFDNVFSFTKNALHLEFSYSIAQMISLFVGFVFAWGVFQWAWYRRERYFKEKVWRESMLISLGLGAAFTVTLSPLSQNNSYILYAPMWILGFLALSQAAGPWKNRLKYALVILFLTMTFAYSDVIPRSTREVVRHLAIKPAICFLFSIFILTYLMTVRKKEQVL